MAEEEYDEFPPNIAELSYLQKYSARYQGDNYCYDGIFHHKWCCPSWCDKCGGYGCAGVDGTQNKECCTGNFKHSCAHHDAPCILNTHDQSKTGLCVLSTYYPKHLGGNYRLVGQYNGKPYWQKDYEYYNEDNMLTQGSMYIFYDYYYWRINKKLGGWGTDPGYSRDRTHDGYMPFDTEWLFYMQVFEGNCEDHYAY